MYHLERYGLICICCAAAFKVKDVAELLECNYTKTYLTIRSLQLQDMNSMEIDVKREPDDDDDEMPLVNVFVSIGVKHKIVSCQHYFINCISCKAYLGTQV